VAAADSREEALYLMRRRMGQETKDFTVPLDWRRDAQEDRGPSAVPSSWVNVHASFSGLICLFIMDVHA